MTRFAETRHHLATTAALVILFWIAAAGAVAAAQAGGAAVKIAAILLASYCYTRFCARYGGISHALGVGIAWLALGITTELVMAAHFGRAWYAVLGSPDRPLLRNVFFFVWIFAPALCARRDDE
jgi:hypothetical protein